MAHLTRDLQVRFKRRNSNQGKGMTSLFPRGREGECGGNDKSKNQVLKKPENGERGPTESATKIASDVKEKKGKKAKTYFYSGKWGVDLCG